MYIVSTKYGFITGIIKILLSFTDSISHNGDIPASVFYTVAGFAQFLLGLFYPPFARMGVNYFLCSTNLALVWANICSLIASIKYIL